MCQSPAGCTDQNRLRKWLASPPLPPFLHTLPPSSPPPGAPRKNEALARAERASLEASLSSLQRRCSPRATAQLPHLRGRPLSSLEPGSPQRRIPGDSRPVTRPTQLAAARESRGGKGAAEGGAAGYRRSPRPDTKRPARPAPPVPTRPAGLGRLQAAIPLLPRSQVSRPWPSRWPEALTGQTPPRSAATAKAKAGGGAREDPGSRDRPLTRAPRSCPGPSGALSKADRRRQRRRAAGRRRERRRRRVRGADPARPPGASSAGLSRSGFGAAPRLLSGFRAEGGL